MAEKKLKLNQIIAIANGEKSRAKKVITKLYQKMDKEPLFSGLTKTYESIEEEGERLPKEEKFVQLTVREAVEEVSEALKQMINIVGSQDLGNCQAKADISIDDKVIVAEVPVTHLLFLEKQLEDITSFVNAMPVLDPSEKWTFNEQTNCYVSEEKQTIRTKKTPEVIVKYEATEKHPAQTELIYVDKLAGHWNTIKFSGAIGRLEKEKILERVRKLQKAVKFAREEANGTEAEKTDYGTRLLDYIFG